MLLYHHQYDAKPLLSCETCTSAMELRTMLLTSASDGICYRRRFCASEGGAAVVFNSAGSFTLEEYDYVTEYLLPEPER